MFCFHQNKSVLLPTYYQLCHFVATEQSPNTRINKTSTVNKEDKPLQKDSQKITNMQLLSSTHTRRVYIVSYLIVLKKSNLRAKIQDVFSSLNFHN